MAGAARRHRVRVSARYHSRQFSRTAHRSLPPFTFTAEPMPHHASDPTAAIDADVLVIGGGSCAAALLAKNGPKVAVEMREEILHG